MLTTLKECKKCIAMSAKDTHKHIPPDTDSGCPVCGEYMPTSSKPVVAMDCIHSIHQQCYNEYIKPSNRCPLCKRRAFLEPPADIPSSEDYSTDVLENAGKEFSERPTDRPSNDVHVQQQPPPAPTFLEVLVSRIPRPPSPWLP